MHYVIIGNGGAGVKALQTIRDNDSNSKITIISREQYPAYSPCSLPNLISREINKPSIFRFDDEFYKRLNATFLKNTKALEIIPSKKIIKLSTGKNLNYDKLLVAAGATPITPKKISGINLKGVHFMGTLDSTLGILNQVEYGVKHAVVVGGGFMGIETAIMLNKRKIAVSIVEMLSRILSRMLDPDISIKVEEILKSHGVKLHLKRSVKEIIGKKKVAKVDIGNKNLDCDMVVFAIGVKPNIELIKNSGIKTNYGIIVDSKMQTNIKDIYAAGDIAEVWEQIEGNKGLFAIWPNAIEQGRIAALNMVGKDTMYDGAEVVNVLDIYNIPVIAMGTTSNDIDIYENISKNTPRYSKKLLIKDNKIVGLQFIGTIRNSGIFYSLMKKGTDVTDIRDKLLDDNFVINTEIVNR